MILYLIFAGVGVWGVNNPVGWGFAIVNFVFWVGIGHAGTLISAILFLFRQKWRTGINRFAEAMTIFAVICAGEMTPVQRTWAPKSWVAVQAMTAASSATVPWSLFQSVVVFSAIVIHAALS